MQAQVFPSSTGINVFLSFVPSGERAARRMLVKALSSLSWQGALNLWSDDDIRPGQDGAGEIERHLQAAQIILLLVSPACVDSLDWQKQMEAILAQEKRVGVSIVPVLLHPTAGWQKAPFGHLSPLPADGRPISSFSKREDGWFQVAEGVGALIEHMMQQAPQAAAASVWRAPLPTPYPAVSRRLRTLPPAPHPVTSIPRPQLVAEIYERLTGPGLSVLVLTGIGGLGKSALAAQVCQFAETQRLAGQGPFLASALWLNLDATTSLLDVFGTLCQAYGVAVPFVQTMTSDDLVETLFQIVQQSQEPRLLVLNQFEQWLDLRTRYPRTEHPSAGTWLELLNSHPCTSRILLTSRVYPHGTGLHLDAYVQRLPLTGLTQAEGLQLLRQSARGETDEVLISAVTYYQGHPLALALLRDLLKGDHSLSLAALMQNFSYKQLLVNYLAEQIWQYLYDLQLTQEQRELLLAFATYRQSVPLQDAQRIAEARDGLPARQASTVLRILLDRDLLQAAGNLEYRLQPVLNDFIQAQMRANLQAEQMCQAHRIAAACYQERFSQTSRHVSQPDSDALHLLLEAAWHLCQAGQMAEAYQLIQQEQIFLYLQHWGGNSLLLDLYQHLLPPERWGANTLVAGQLYHDMGSIQNALGQKQAALEYYQRALPLLRETGLSVLIAEALNDLGTIYRALQQEQRAEECYQEAWTLCEQAGEHFQQRGVTLNNLGRLRYEHGRQKQQERLKEQKQEQAYYREALALYEQALAAHRSNNQPEEEGWTLLNLGDVYAILGQRKTAYDYYEQALTRFRQLEMRRGEGTTLNNLGILLASESSESGRAATCYLQALRIFRAVGDCWQERQALRNLGRWLIVSAPAQDPARTQGYLRGLACFCAARDMLEERRNPRVGILPGWLGVLLRQELGEQRMEELIQGGAAKCQQIINDLLTMPHDDLS